MLDISIQLLVLPITVNKFSRVQLISASKMARMKETFKLELLCALFFWESAPQIFLAPDAVLFL